MELKSVKVPEAVVQTNDKNDPEQSQSDAVSSKVIRIRAAKEDSAYLYSILESYEGLCAYSTLECLPGDRHRDLEMIVPISQEPALRKLLETIKEELGGELHELYLE